MEGRRRRRVSSQTKGNCIRNGVDGFHVDRSVSAGRYASTVDVGAPQCFNSTRIIKTEGVAKTKIRNAVGPGRGHVRLPGVFGVPA